MEGKIELLTAELSKKVNPCSSCGGHDIGVKEHQERDGCYSWAYCKNCGRSSSHVMYVGIEDPDSLKEIFLRWHEESTEFVQIIKAPKVISVIKELKELADKMEGLEDFDRMDVINGIRMLEKWSGLSS